MVRKSATIQDVAVAAGVSTATVSRTLSKPSVVAKATREAVLSAVERTGYRVNATASNLRRQRTGSVIALLPNLANPFFSQILAGMSAVFRQAGYGLLVADTRAEPDPEGRLTHYLRSGQADGIVLLDGTLSAAPLTRPARLPVVLACEWMHEDLPSVRSDNAGGGALRVAYLVGMGHRRIGHITGPQGNCLSQTRLDGYHAAIAARLLLDMIDAGSLTGPSETIGVELIKRGSVARIAP